MTSSRQDDPETLEELGQRFELLHQLREEPWGEVWLATDRLLHTEVALKLYPRSDPDWAEGQKVLAREAALSFILRHPFILGVSFLGEAEDGLYLVEEPFDGESLMARLAQKQRLPLPQTLRLLEQAGQALAFAHQQGLAHQSLNPLHILLKGEEVRVANFACPPADGDKAMHLELKAYTPPEVLHGEEVSPAGNVFSLGVLGYRLLAGSLPYPLTFDEPFPYRLETMPVDLEEIPLPLQNLLLQCLAPEPEDRFVDAGAFLTHLRQLRELGQGGGKETWIPEEVQGSGAAWPRSGAAGLPGKLLKVANRLGEKIYAGLGALSPRLAPASRRLWWGLGLGGLLIVLLVVGVQVMRHSAPPPEPPPATVATVTPTPSPSPSPSAGPPLKETDEPGAPAEPAPAVQPSQVPPALPAPPMSMAAPQPEKPKLKEEKYLLIAATFPQLDQARTLARRLKAKKFPASLAKTTIKGKTAYQVRLGPFPEKKAAQDAAQRLKKQEHLSPHLVKLQPKPAQAAATPKRPR